MTVTGSQIAHVLAALASGWVLVAGYRWIRRRSAPTAAIVAAAILGRLALGLALFWISYLHLPIAQSLQVPGGFWQGVADASGYYGEAAQAAETGRLFPLDHGIASPFYVDTLALWMMAVGVSPAAGMFLNLMLYMALVLLVVWSFAPVNDVRRDLPCIIGVAAYSFSPVILLHSTQTLKDELAGVLVALVCVGMLWSGRLLRDLRARRPLLKFAGGVLLVGASTFGTAGIRWYDALIIVSAIALTLTICAIRGRTTSLPRYLAGSAALLMAAWLGFWGGAGGHYEMVGADVDRILAWQPPRDLSRREISTSAVAAARRIGAIPADLFNMVQRFRSGFLLSGGGTNIVVPLRQDVAAGAARADQLEQEDRATAGYQPTRERLAEAQRLQGTTRPAATSHDEAATAASPPAAELRALPITPFDHVRAAATGLAIVFVPISLVKALTGIQVAGGRGLLAFVDVDTLFADITSLLVLALLWKRRGAIGDRQPGVVFGLVLSAVTAILLGYVVTNLGTLWRLRASVTIPLWVLVIALSPRTEVPGAADEPSGAPPADSVT